MLLNLLQTVQNDSNYATIVKDAAFNKILARYNKKLIQEITMPNHCHNRVTFYPAGDNTEKAIEDIKAIKQMFEDENVFTDRSYQNQTGLTHHLTSQRAEYG